VTETWLLLGNMGFVGRRIGRADEFAAALGMTHTIG